MPLIMAGSCHWPRASTLMCDDEIIDTEDKLGKIDMQDQLSWFFLSVLVVGFLFPSIFWR